MLAAWNERDPSRVHGPLEKALSDDVHFVDPGVETRGIDEFEANVHAVQARIPGADYRRSSGVDANHGLCRYHWEISLDGKPLRQGFDVTELDDEDRVRRVLGFFGPIPKLAAPTA